VSQSDFEIRNAEHRTHRSGWLRAAVLGVNYWLVSTAALMIGIVSAQKNDFVLTVGIDFAIFVVFLFRDRSNAPAPTVAKDPATIAALRLMFFFF
jgi:hypothetical protein